VTPSETERGKYLLMDYICSEVVLNGDLKVVIDGMVYNFPKDVIGDRLKAIAKHFQQNNVAWKKQVRDFVEGCDGEFLVTVMDRANKKTMVFNDFLGRISPYYYLGKNSFHTSRSLTDIISRLDSVEFDKASIVEFLMFEYALGSKTWFKDIYRFEPAQVLVITEEDGRLLHEAYQHPSFNFNLSNPFESKAESIELLKRDFLESCKNRVATLQKEGYRLSVSLGGGLDSKITLGGLCRFTKQVDAYTFEYVTDESPAAKKLFDLVASNGKYRKLEIPDLLSSQGFDLPKLIYENDCFSSYPNMVISYKNLKEIQKDTENYKSARAGGYGADFINKALKFCPISLFYGTTHGMFSYIPLKVACAVAKISPEDYKQRLKNHLDKYPERRLDNQLKRFYYEQYHKYHLGKAEDFERTISWTSHPLMGLNFVRTTMNRVPLRWIGKPYYLEFIRAVDPRLLTIPIPGSKTRLDNTFIINLKYRLRNNIFSLSAKWLIHNNFAARFLLFRSRKLRKKENSNSRIMAYKSKTHILDFQAIEQLLSSELGKSYQATSDRLLTLLIYIQEVKKHVLVKNE